MSKQRSLVMRKVCRVLLACVFAQYALLPRTALAWDQRTHRQLVDWAYQVARLTEYEMAPSPKPRAAYLDVVTGSTTAPGTLTLPPAGCTGTCATNWNAFLDGVAAARAKLALMPFGPDTKNLDQHDGNTTCGPPVTGIAVGDYPFMLHGRPPECDREASSVYEAGGIFDDPEVAGLPHPLLGNTLGFISAAADERLEDWELEVDPLLLVAGGLSWLLTLGNSTNALDPIVDTYNGIKNILTTAAALPLAVVFFLLSLGQVDIFDAFEAAKDVTNFIADFDLTMFAVVEPLLDGIPELVAGEEADVGLGHFINVQPQVTTLFGTTWPSNDYDDFQGLFYDEALYNVAPVGSGQAALFQDSFDHYLIETTGLGVVIDPDDSFGVGHYQDGSDVRGFIDDDAYWNETELHAIAFTPLEKLAFYGWDLFHNDSCKNSEYLLWPLHAIGDAAVPMHAIATTGQGHRPFESGIYTNADQWESVRHLSPTEFRPLANGDADPVDYPNTGAGNAARTADFIAQYAQSHAILEEAFAWFQTMPVFQPVDNIQTKLFITQVAQKTLEVLHNDTAKVRCDRNACQQLTFEESPPCTPLPHSTKCPSFVEIHCDGDCDGFAPAVDPTATHVHCSLLGKNPNNLPACTIEARIAVELSSSTYANVEYPAVLAPGLSEIWDSRQDFAEPWYKSYVADHRRFAEIAVAAMLAFLVRTGDQVGTPSPQACLCGPTDTYCGSPTGQCVDLQRDRYNCGACGQVCQPGELCSGGQCTSPCTSPWQLCSGVCSDLQFDDNNCGACGLVCPPNLFCDQGSCIELI